MIFLGVAVVFRAKDGYPEYQVSWESWDIIEKVVAEWTSLVE